MDISVIICTYNRAEILRETLSSFMLMQRPADLQCEVIIVDNNSNDNTSAVSDEFCRRNPELFRYLSEPMQGLSFARNAGIRSSSAGLIAFVDDDIYFDQGWLLEMLDLFRTTDAMGAGGKSIPLFEGGTPSWISTKVLSLYGSTNSGDAVKRMIFPDHPFGLNMVFRREVFERIGLFNVTLGRIKKSLLSNEEYELFYRIDRGRLPVFYTPLAIIHHRIPESRTRKSWVLRRYYYQGLSDMVFAQIAKPWSRAGQIRGLPGKLIWLSRAAFGAVWARVAPGIGEDVAFQRLIMTVYAAGIVAGAVRDIFGRHRTGAVSD
jgi:glycosyltransferase involved in cell wall biosynthesis